MLAAVGGAMLPAAIFLALTAGVARPRGLGDPDGDRHRVRRSGCWVLGDRVSAGVKLLVLAIAIVDDIIAIAVIALFYSEHLSPGWLVAAVAGRAGVCCAGSG